MAKMHKENKDAWAAADDERNKRFEDLKDRFNASDKRHEICEQERARMHEQWFDFLLKEREKKPTI